MISKKAKICDFSVNTVGYVRTTGYIEALGYRSLEQESIFDIVYSFEDSQVTH